MNTTKDNRKYPKTYTFRITTENYNNLKCLKKEGGKIANFLNEIIKENYQKEIDFYRYIKKELNND